MSAAVRFWQLLSAVQIHFRTAQRWKAKLRARTASNFKLRLAMLLLLSLINVVVGAFLYKAAAGEDWGGSLFTVYSVLYNVPGSDITSAPTFMGTVVLNLIFIFGLLVFATILAMITEEVNSVLLAARSGKSPLTMSEHILLLNWNNQVSFILDQLEAAALGDGSHPFAGRPVVILADRDKEEMDALVVGVLKSHELEVHTRTGKPYKLEHLERVSAADAAAVLVLHPDSTEGGGGDGGDDNSSVSDIGAAGGGDGAADCAGAAALKMQTIMALSSQLLGKKAAIVVQVPETGPSDGSGQLQLLDQVLVMAGHPSHLLNLPVKRMVNSLAIQTAIQPWSATIYNQILQQGQQPALTFLQLPEALCSGARVAPSSLSGSDSITSSFTDAGAGCALYGETRVHYAAAELLLVGFISARSGKLHLNPHESSRLRAGDTLVALQRGKVHSDKVVPQRWRRMLDSALMKLNDLRQQRAANKSTVAAAGAAAATAAGAAAAASSGAAAEAGAEQAAQDDDALTSSSSSTSGQPAAASGLGRIAEEEDSPAKVRPADAAALVGAGAVGEVQPEAGPGTPGGAAAAGAAAATLGGAGVATAISSGASPAVEEPISPVAGQADAPGAESADSEAVGLAAGDDVGAPNSATDQLSKSRKAAAAAAAVGGVAAVTGAAVSSKKKSKKKKSWLAACCMSAPAADEEHGGQAKKKPALKAAATFKKGAAGLTKGVTGMAGAVTTAAGEAAKGVVSGVTTVTGAVVDTVGTVVTTTAGAVGTVVTTTAGAVGSVVATTAGAVGSVGATVGGGIANIGRGAADSLTFKPAASGDAASGGLLGTPASWLFGAGKMITNQTAKALAGMRLSKVSASAQGPPTTPQWIVVAGFTAAEAGEELLPHFLAFAPPSSTVVFVVREGEDPPGGLGLTGEAQEMEEREDGPPIHHHIKYRFLPSSSPGNRASLAAAGLVRADAVLLSADESIRGSPAEADAQVLGGLLEIQHLLASHREQQQQQQAAARAARGSLAVMPSAGSSSSAGAPGIAAPFAAVASAGSRTFGRITSFGKAAITGGPAEPAAGAEAGGPPSLTSELAAAHHQRDPTHVLHVVACVATTASKAVAAAFFGSPSAAAAAAEAGDGIIKAGRRDGSSGVVGSNLFTYELLVPGEIEGAVLVQVANEPAYVKVVREMLGSSEGCELYLLSPAAFGFSPGEALAFPEVAEVGRLLRKTAVGVVAGGAVVLLPERGWRWRVAASDRIIAIADSW